jgi:CheY-like chemotaxis protein
VKNNHLNNQLILLVDDEKIVLEVVLMMLQRIGYDVLTAGNGDEAVELYRKCHSQIDLVMIDMIMPHDGERTYHELKAIDTDVKVLLTSGYTQDRKVRCLISQGAKGFIQKPFSIGSLKDKITTALTSD